MEQEEEDGAKTSEEFFRRRRIFFSCCRSRLAFPLIDLTTSQPATDTPPKRLGAQHSSSARPSSSEITMSLVYFESRSSGVVTSRRCTMLHSTRLTPLRRLRDKRAIVTSKATRVKDLLRRLLCTGYRVPPASLPPSKFLPVHEHIYKTPELRFSHSLPSL